MGEKKKDDTLALIFVNIFNIRSLKSILRNGKYIDISSIIFYTSICLKYFTKNTWKKEYFGAYQSTTK